MMHPQIFIGIEQKQKYLLHHYKTDTTSLVAELLGINKENFLSKSRKRENVIARMICSKLIYKNRVSLKQVAKILGLLDHSSVIYLNKTFDNHLHTKDAFFMTYYEKVKHLF